MNTKQVHRYREHAPQSSMHHFVLHTLYHRYILSILRSAEIWCWSTKETSNLHSHIMDLVSLSESERAPEIGSRSYKLHLWEFFFFCPLQNFLRDCQSYSFFFSFFYLHFECVKSLHMIITRVWKNCRILSRDIIKIM